MYRRCISRNVEVNHYVKSHPSTANVHMMMTSGFMPVYEMRSEVRHAYSYYQSSLGYRRQYDRSCETLTRRPSDRSELDNSVVRWVCTAEPVRSLEMPLDVY